MKWDEMSPRERDALVAEKVIGWTDFSPINPDVDYEVGVNGHRRNFAFSPSEKYQPIPHYTTDISAAWQVFEHIKPKFTWVEIGTSAEGSWWAHVGQFDKTFSNAPTAPEAICLAALRAVGVDV